MRISHGELSLAGLDSRMETVPYKEAEDRGRVLLQASYPVTCSPLLPIPGLQEKDKHSVPAPAAERRAAAGFSTRLINSGEF